MITKLKLKSIYIILDGITNALYFYFHLYIIFVGYYILGQSNNFNIFISNIFDNFNLIFFNTNNILLIFTILFFNFFKDKIGKKIDNNDDEEFKKSILEKIKKTFDK